MKYLVDTCSLMHHLPNIQFEEVIVSSMVLRELEKHKSNFNDREKAIAAYQALHAIEDHEKVIEFDLNQYPQFNHLSPNDYDISYPDNRLLEALCQYRVKGEEVGLITDDLGLKLQAIGFGFQAKKAGDRPIQDKYQGTQVIHEHDPRMALFYQMYMNPRHINVFDNLVGEYVLFVKPKKDPLDPNEEEHATEAYKWDGERYHPIRMNQSFTSSCFDEVKPQNLRQAIAMDSLANNPLSAITGKAGGGKSFLAISYILEQIERYEKQVYIVTNNVPMRGASTFGLKKGDLITKVLQSNLGSILKTKLGLDYTESLIQQEKLNIVALEDIRGASFNGIIYVTEVQNYSKDMIKTILERIEAGGQVILDGDERQIDTPIAKGMNNGLDRMMEIFRGSGYFGHVELQKNIRGGISMLAEKM